MIECDIAAYRVDRLAIGVLGILGGHAAQLVNTIETRERFGDLRADRGDADERRRDETDEKDVLHELAERHGAAQDRAAADDDHQHADSPDHELRECADAGDAGHRRRDVAEQLVRAARKNEPLAPLGAIRLHDPDAAERLRQPAGDVGVQLAALAEQRAQLGKGERHPAAEQREHEDRERRQFPVQPEQHAERDAGRDEAAEQLHQSGADQVPNALGVGHDAGDQDARLGGIEVADRQPQHECLNGLAHVGDRALRRHAKDLGEPVRGHGLNQRRDADRDGDDRQQLSPPLPDDVVDDVAGGARQHEPSDAVDEHQHEPKREAPAVLPDQSLRFAPGVGIVWFGFLLGHGEKLTW